MTQKKIHEMLLLMKPGIFITAETLAAKLSVSEKTVRLALNDLKKTVMKHGAVILSKPHYGYSLKIQKPQCFEEYCNSLLCDLCIPNSQNERVDYLMAYLIFKQDYIKTEELCNFIYVSKTTLSKCLKSIEETLKQYHLSIERRPNYGIRISGNEFNKRQLIVNSFVKHCGFGGINISHQLQEIDALAQKIDSLTSRYGIFLSEISLDNFVSYTYVAYKRMKSGNYLSLIPPPPDCLHMKITDKLFIRELFDYLSELGGINHTPTEETFLLICLMTGKRTGGNLVENTVNFVIPENIDQLSLRILQLIGNEYHLDILNDFDIRMTLNQHLVPFDIRMRYEIPLKNPFLQEIKENYSLAYQAAGIAANLLSDIYKKPIPEDEVGYFALIVQLALEKQHCKSRSNILIICSSGKVSSQLLKYKYQKEFAEYLDNIWVCDVAALESFNFSQIDFIFTTVPITRKVPVPIIEIEHFLDDENKRKVADTLTLNDIERAICTYYRPERFLPHISGNTKQEVLANIYKVIQSQEEVDDDFLELVMEREQLIQMNYGTQIAIPHPLHIASEHSFAYVAILPEPVSWNGSPVQVVLLISIGRTGDSEEMRRLFYETTARFSLNKTAVEALIESPYYSTFIQLLKNR